MSPGRRFGGPCNLRGRGWLSDPEPPAAPAEGWSAVTYVDRDVGRVTSLAFVPETGVAGAGRWIGLALIRREVEPGSVVRAAGRDARVVDLPFAFPIAAPAGACSLRARAASSAVTWSRPSPPGGSRGGAWWGPASRPPAR